MVSLVHRGRPGPAHLPDRHPRSLRVPPPASRGRCEARGPWSDQLVHRRARSGRAAPSAWPVLPLEVPHPRRLVAITPVLVVHRPARKAKRLRITVKALGDYTAALQQAKPGTRLIAEGPYGAITAALRSSREVALLA